MKDDYRQRGAAKHAADRVTTSAELAAAQAAAPSDYKCGGTIGWQCGTTDEITCRMLVSFVLWNQPRAQWFKNSPRAITLTLPSVKANGTIVCTLDSQQHFNNSQLEDTVKRWAQTHQPGEPALLCNFTT